MIVKWFQVIAADPSGFAVDELDAPQRLDVPADAATTLRDGRVIRSWVATGLLHDDRCAACAVGACVQQIESGPHADLIVHDCAGDLS